MRKVEIEARRLELDKQLNSGRVKAIHQDDERRRLMVECQMAGDHVPTHSPVMNNGVFHWIKVCQFCGMQMGAGQEQVARNLTLG